MGLLALGVLWVNTLLIAGDAWRRRGALARRLTELRAARARGTLVVAEIVRGAASDGVFARRRVQQVGRAMTVPGPQRILFTDARSEAEVYGGEVRIGEQTFAVEAAPDVELWCAPSAERGDVGAFDEAWPHASTFKGLCTELVHVLRPGDRAWVWLDREGEGARVRLVASDDPVGVLERAQVPLAAVAVGALVGASVVTALALWPPPFGLVSTLGGALGLAFFLVIQPLGTAARDRARLPSEQPVGGRWQRPA
jgi:hypothetical protein